MYHQIVGVQQFLDDDTKETKKKNQRTFSNHDNFNEDNQNSQLQLKNQTNSSFTSFHCLLAYFNHYSGVFNKKSTNPFNIQNRSVNFQNNNTNLQSILSNLLFSTNQQSPSKEKDNTSKLIPQQIASKIKEYQQNQAQKIQAHLLRSKRFHKVQSFKRQIFIHDIRWSKHFEIVELEVQLLNYKTVICILNQTKESSLHQEAKIHDKGTFGDVYFIRLQQESIAVKCITFPSEEHLDNLKIKTKLFGTVLKEYFFVLLFSELQIGPRAKTLGGFDMVFHQSCIEFATQVCLSVDPLKNLADEMTKSLFVMHMLKIIHRDVKPENILFSPTFNKHVFIDFGCTGILNEAIGEVTFTKFAGTAAYCTEELVQLLGQNHGFVDLYFNDMYGLKKSLTEFRQCKKSFIHQNQIIPIEVADVYLNFMKYSLFREDYPFFYEIWREVRKRYPHQFQIFQEQIVRFFIEIPPSQFLMSFYWLQIDEYTRENEQFEQLNLMYKNKENSFLMNLRFDAIKQNKFNTHRLIYKNLHIDNGSLSNKQKEISRIMLTKQLVKKYLCEQSFMLQNIFQSQKTLNQAELLKYCIVVVKSSSLDSNQYQFTYKEKITLCEEALRLISTVDKQNLQSVSMLFSSPFTQFMPVMVFFHYFLLNIWTQLSSNQQYESMVSVIGTFCLLGYPAKSQIPSAYLISHFLFPSNQNQQTLNKLNCEQKIDKILIYWECKITSFYYSKFYSKQKFLLDFERFTYQFSRYYEKLNILMQPEQNQTNQFFLINYRFYKQIQDSLLYFNENSFDKFMNILNSDSIKILQQQYPKVKRWKQLMHIILLNVTQAFNIKDCHSFFNFIEKILVSQINRYPKRLFPYLIIYDKSIYCKNVNIMYSMLRKIDQVLKIETFSRKLQINTRFYIACHKKDINILKQVMQIIRQELFFVVLEKEITQVDQFWNQRIFLIQKILDVIINVEKDNFFENYLLEGNSFTVELFCYFNQIINLANQLAQKLHKYRNSHSKFGEIICSKEAPDSSIGQWINDIRIIKEYFAILLSTASVHKQMKSFLKSNYVEQFLQKAESHLKNRNFIERLQKSEKKGDFSLQMIEFVNKNIQVKQKIKKSSVLTSQFVEIFLLNHQPKQNTQFDMIFQQFATDLSIENLRKLKTNILPSVKFVQTYYIKKIINTNYQLEFCQKLIQLYYFYFEKNCLELLFSDAPLTKVLINCFIYTEKSYRKIQDLLEKICLALEKSSNENTVSIFCVCLDKFFWCPCKLCMPRETKNWNSMNFIQFLHENIDMNKTISNPYFSLVYFYSIFKKLPNKMKCEKIVRFLLMSLPYLEGYAKRVIAWQIQALVYHSQAMLDEDDQKNEKMNQNRKQIKREKRELRKKRIHRRKQYIIYETNNKKRSYDTFLSTVSMFVDDTEKSIGRKIRKLLTEKLIRYFQLKNQQKVIRQK